MSRFIRYCICLTCSLFLMGCALEVNPKVTTAMFANLSNPPDLRFPQKVDLKLSDGFVGYDYRFNRGANPYLYHLGPSLEAYARATAESFFQSPLIVRGENVTPGDNELILTPKVSKVDLTSFVWGWEKQTMIIEVEWTLKRKNSSSPIWAVTLAGKASGLDGNPFNGFRENGEMVRDVMLDLWKQTGPAFEKLKGLESLRNH